MSRLDRKVSDGDSPGCYLIIQKESLYQIQIYSVYMYIQGHNNLNVTSYFIYDNKSERKNIKSLVRNSHVFLDEVRKITDVS